MEQCPCSHSGRCGEMLLTQCSRIMLLPACRTQGWNSLSPTRHWIELSHITSQDTGQHFPAL